MSLNKKTDAIFIGQSIVEGMRARKMDNILAEERDEFHSWFCRLLLSSASHNNTGHALEVCWQRDILRNCKDTLFLSWLYTSYYDKQLQEVVYPEESEIEDRNKNA